ncbi:40b249c8-4e13-42b0-91eb-291b36150e80 [Thermothielavioides terrestris]|nr:40b249c8-4e13-42b0-91eb-291b36150e80 [Thermothielavioides terrestris]
MFIGHWGAYDPATSCYPTSTKLFLFVQEYYYSPGICPSGYWFACPWTGTSFPASVTASLCCPSDFECVDGWSHVCARGGSFDGLEHVFVISRNSQTLASTAALTTATLEPDSFIWADGVPVAWETTDTAILKLLGQLTTTSSTSGTSLSEESSSSIGRTSSEVAPKTSGTATATATDTGGSSLLVSPSTSTSDSQTTPSSTTGPTPTTAAITSEPLLTGNCASPSWTLLDMSTAYLYAPVLGCAYDNLNCCPFQVDAAPRTGAPGPFPAASVARCPDGYVTVTSSACCLSGFQPLSTAFVSQSACVSRLSSPLSQPPLPTTAQDASVTVGVVLAMQIPIETAAPSSGSGLSKGAVAGIAVGGAVALLVIATLVFLLVRKSRPPQPVSGLMVPEDKHPPVHVYPSELHGQGVSELPYQRDFCAELPGAAR